MPGMCRAFKVVSKDERLKVGEKRVKIKLKGIYVPNFQPKYTATLIQIRMQACLTFNYFYGPYLICKCMCTFTCRNLS